MLSRQGQVKGVHHHQAIITWNVKGTYLRKRRRSKLWTVRWQQMHSYQQLNLKKQKQTKKTTGRGTDSQKWRSHGGLPEGNSARSMGEKAQGIRSIIGPWLVWLSGLSAGLWTRGSPVWFPVRAYAWAASQVPNRGCARGNHTLMFPFLSFSLPFSLKNK